MSDFASDVDFAIDDIDSEHERGDSFKWMYLVLATGATVMLAGMTRQRRRSRIQMEQATSDCSARSGIVPHRVDDDDADPGVAADRFFAEEYDYSRHDDEQHPPTSSMKTACDTAPYLPRTQAPPAIVSLDGKEDRLAWKEHVQASRAKATISWQRSIAATLLLALAIIGAVRARISTLHLAQRSTQSTSRVDRDPSRVLRYRPIAEVRVGDRVTVADPEGQNAIAETGPSEIVPNRVHISLNAGSSTSSNVHIELIRTREWLAENIEPDGHHLRLDIGDFASSRLAEIVSVVPFVVDQKPGRLVTGTFRHRVHDILRLKVAGLPEEIRCTTTHRFWSVDRGQFVAANDLKVGERLQGKNNSGVFDLQVLDIEQLIGEYDVYNLEVEGEHTYRVSSGGILVHNSCAEESRPGKDAVEAASKARAEQQLGRKLTDSKDPAVDWVDSAGRTYDQMGNPNMIPHWDNQRQRFFDQINRHLNKADFTVIDLTGFPQNIKNDVADFVLNLPVVQFDKIIPIGF